MANVRIEWLHDSYSDCETCGTSYAEGARVYVDDRLVIDLTPVAHCTNPAHYSEQEVFGRVLEHLGHSYQDSFANLREATIAQNHHNSRGRKADKLKGAFWHKRDQRWRAQIYLNAKPIHLGYFDSELEAHNAYCEAAKKYHGEFARTA